MKVILLNLFGTIIEIPRLTMTVDPMLKDSLLRGENITIDKDLDKAFKGQIAATRLYPEIPEVSSRFGGNQDFVCFSISNLSKQFVPCFYQYGLDTWLTPIFSCETGLVKPEEGIYKIALNKITKLLPETEQIYMVGDSLMNDYVTPKLLGIRSFWLNRKDSVSYPSEEDTVTDLLEFYEK